MVFGQPVERVVDEEVPHSSAFGPIKVDGTTPRSAVALGKELRRIRIKVISFRAKVVADNIQQDHNSAAMGSLNKVLKIFGTAVATVWREGINAVIAPISPARKVGDGHQLQRCDSKISEVIELFAYSHESPGGSEGSHVQFIDDSFLPAAAMPVAIPPVESRWVDHFARLVHVPRLKTGRWIWNVLRIVDAERILRSRFGFAGGQLEPAILDPVKRKLHGFVRTAEAKSYLMRSRSPQAKANIPIFATLRAERHAMTALHSHLPFCHFHGAPSEPPSSALAAGRQCQHRSYLPDAVPRPGMCPSMRSSECRDETQAE